MQHSSIALFSLDVFWMHFAGWSKLFANLTPSIALSPKIFSMYFVLLFKT